MELYFRCITFLYVCYLLTKNLLKNIPSRLRSHLFSTSTSLPLFVHLTHCHVVIFPTLIPMGPLGAPGQRNKAMSVLESPLPA